MGAIVIVADEILPPDETDRGQPPEFRFVNEISWGISYSGLERLKDYCEEQGVPRDIWPDYVELDGDASQISLEKVYEKNRLLKSTLLQLEDAIVAENRHLLPIVAEVKAGKLLFFGN